MDMLPLIKKKADFFVIAPSEDMFQFPSWLLRLSYRRPSENHSPHCYHSTTDSRRSDAVRLGLFPVPAMISAEEESPYLLY